MDWDKLRIFYAVAQSKSLTRAGESLNLSQSAVSRQISALEERMGVALFHRHARGLILTEHGEILFRTVSEMVSKLQTAESLLAETSAKPKGPFKITVPHALGNIWVTPLMQEFCELYPDIEVTLILDDRELDLSMREADVAMRFYPARHPDLIQKPLFTLNNAIYASNDYLRIHGVPKHLEDLQHHRLIAYGGNPNPPFEEVNWLTDKLAAKKKTAKSYFTINSLTGIRTAVKNGMGVAALPGYMMYRARHVSRILHEIEGPRCEAYFVYPLELKNSKRIAVLRNFLTRKIAEYDF